MTESMRVLAVINGLGTGGAERSLAEMLPGLEDAGIHVVVACLYRRERGVEQNVLAGHDVRFIGSKRLPGRVGAIRRLIAAERPHILHTTILESHLAGRIAGVGSRVTVLSSLVSTPYVEARLGDPRLSAAKLGLVRMADGWTARHMTHHFHAITHAVKKHAQETLRIPRDRITVVKRGRDPKRLGEPSSVRRQQARRMLQISPDAEVLVCLGRQEFAKGHRYLLDAVSALAGHRPNLIALLAGRDGMESHVLRAERERSGLGDRFRFMGHREDAAELLAAADVFVFPSLFEGLGGSLIEAMALGLPIVATDIPAIREVVEEGANARLVSPASGTALARAVEALLDAPDQRRAFGARSRVIFEDQFTIERSTKEMIDLYSRLADGSSSGRQTHATPTDPTGQSSQDECSEANRQRDEPAPSRAGPRSDGGCRGGRFLP